MAIKEDGTVYFNEQEQVELDKVIGERLARDRRESETKLKEYEEALNELDDFGYVGTPSEKKAAIKAYKDELKKQSELEELQNHAKQTGTSPELLTEIKALKDEIKELKSDREERDKEKQSKEKEMQSQKQSEEAWNAQVKEFEEEFPDSSLEEIGRNEKFIDFIEGSGWSLKQAYKKFVKIHGEIESETIGKVVSKQLRSTSNARGESSTGNSGLSAEQKADLNAWNKKYPHLAMTAQEFKNK